MSTPIYSLTKSELYLKLAIFLFGLLIGAVIINLYTGKIVDYYILENKILMDKLQNSHNTINKLNKTIKNQKENPIKEINININSEFNEHKEQEIKKNIYQIIENIIGTEINEIDIDLLINNIDDRHIVIEGKNYRIKLKYIIIAEKTIILIKAE